MSSLDVVLGFVISLYLVSAILFLYRIIRGPTVFDRVIALDSFSYDLAVFIALIAIVIRQSLIAVSMIPIALWTYTLDVYVSWYLERQLDKRGDSDD